MYLYESEKNYGLRPTLKFDASTNSTYDDSLVYKFDEYQEEKAIQETSREYRVFHNIESTFKIETGLDNELSLNAEVSLANNKVEVVPSANNKLELLRYSNPSFSLVNDSISLSNEFSVKIPYTIYYSSPTSLKTYALSRLNDGAILHKVILQHVSREENNGKF
ncbi:MAG: hypothetical protein K2G70_01180 [Turicibacter sp.]|nr:hypothetical protein [Turicibacter sp.]